jgi:fermentation-respiration switch protein FrsA (DUF1100 family)
MKLPRFAWSALLAGLFLVASIAGFAWFVGGELCAAVPRAIGPPPPQLSAQSVMFPSASGSMIHGWFSPGRPGEGAVLLLHGVRGDRRDMLSRAEFLHGLGYSVLSIDFQAHGESPGGQITFGDRESRDVVAALTFLHRTLPQEKVGAIGVSLGAAAFVLADSRPHVDAAVLESMYPTVEQALADRLRLHVGALGPMLAPLLRVQLRPRLGIAADRLRPIDRMAAIGAPVLILNGTRDAHTSLKEAQALFAAASNPKEFWAVPGAAHVNLHTYAKAEYERRVGEFLARYLQSDRAAALPGWSR